MEDFQEYWRTTHADLVRQIPGIQRCVQCHTLLSGYGRPSPPVLDGVVEISFDSTADFAFAIKTPAGEIAMAEYTATRADEKNFLTEPLPFIITREVKIM